MLLVRLAKWAFCVAGHVFAGLLVALCLGGLGASVWLLVSHGHWVAALLLVPVLLFAAWPFYAVWRRDGLAGIFD